MRNSQNIKSYNSFSIINWYKKLIKKKDVSIQKKKDKLFIHFIDLIILFINRVPQPKSNCKEFLPRLEAFYKEYIVFAPNGSVNLYFSFLRKLDCTKNADLHIPKMMRIIVDLKNDLGITVETYDNCKQRVYKALIKAQLDADSLYYSPIVPSASIL